AYIPTASMADIAFLLIVFFMVTTVFQVDKTSVNLPLTWERSSEIPRGAAFVVLANIISGDGGKKLVYKFSAGKDTSQIVTGTEGLYAEVVNVTAASAEHPFVIKIDKDIKYRLVDEILDTMRRAGALNLILMSEQKTVSNS
ncbi:MAG: ExbD/TolR family protein, partial [Acidobacteriota bacterium]